ncbi:MAG: copper chaperone PCu(A)C [Rhizobacter sp.]
MTHKLRFLVALSLSALSFAAQAHSFQLGELKIGHPYARSTAPGQPAGGGYLSIQNTGGAADKLVSAQAEVSTRVELHEMKMDGDVMRMREISAVDVPAGKTVELKPGGLHIMFIGLKAPLKQGDKFPVKLKFEKAGEVTVTVNVEGAGAVHDMKH